MLPTSEELVQTLKFPATGLRAVLIQGAHGGFGDENGSSRGLSGASDLSWLLATRATADAVIVSFTTAIREHYRLITFKEELLRARRNLGLSDLPKLVVITRNPTSAHTAEEFADIVLNTSAQPLRRALESLNEQGLVRLSCEGGPQLIDALMAEKLVDQLALTTSPIGAANLTVYPHIQEFQNQIPVWQAQFDDFNFELIGQLPQWDEKLSGLAFDVLRKHATERPFSAEYEKSPAPGYYVCKGCGNRLFDADTQFDARCGWPAFWRPSKHDGVTLIEDNSMFMRRIEVRCKACNGHLGHVFTGEGFGFPTDQRYCINAIALERRF